MTIGLIVARLSELYFKNTMSRAVNFFVKADARESSEKRVSRYKRWFNLSRVGNLVKSRRYRRKKATRRLRRDGALMRAHYRAERERNKYYS